MHCICLFWINPFVFTIFKLLSFFVMFDSRLKILNLLREDDENDTMIFTVCFWTNPADEVHALFQILNSGVIRKIMPSQPLWAKEVGVFLFKKLKPLIITWGRVVFSVDPGAQWMASKVPFQNKIRWWFRIIVRTGSHYLSK